MTSDGKTERELVEKALDGWSYATANKSGEWQVDDELVDTVLRLRQAARAEGVTQGKADVADILWELQSKHERLAAAARALRAAQRRYLGRDKHDVRKEELGRAVGVAAEEVDAALSSESASVAVERPSCQHEHVVSDFVNRYCTD